MNTTNTINTTAWKELTRVYEMLGSVKLAVCLLSIASATVLLGSWCPQSAQVGREKVVEQFGEAAAQWLEKFGVTDIFHTPFFLALVSMLAVSLLAASLQHVFPAAINRYKQKLKILDETEILHQPCNRCETISVSATQLSASLASLVSRLRKVHYRVHQDGNRLAAERGKIGGMAAAVTHVGLIVLLTGVTVTSWTGFSGFEPIMRGGTLSFLSSEHSKLWLGRLPDWHVKVNDTSRVDYPTGEPKQWYSNLSVVDKHNRVLKTQVISVNDPLSFRGVDIYQSSWAFNHILVSFNENHRVLPLRSMGRIMAAFVPLDPKTILIFSVKDTTSPVRLFAKTSDWISPKLIATIKPGTTALLGPIALSYDGPLPTTGLQYKSDPGFPLTYAGFVFIIIGVGLAAVPYRQLWVSIKPHDGADSSSLVTIGGVSSKAMRSFERDLDKWLYELATGSRQAGESERVIEHEHVTNAA